MGSAVIVFLLSQLVDLITFLVCVQTFPIEGEWNPLARGLYQAFGPQGVIGLKVIAAGIVTVLLLVSRPAREKGLGLATSIGLLGASINSFALLVSG